MIGLSVVFVLVALEVTLFFLQGKESNVARRMHMFSRIVLGAVMLLFFGTTVLHWNLAWFGVMLYLVVTGTWPLITIWRGRQPKNRRAGALVGKIVLIGFLSIPFALFPQPKYVEPTGSYPVASEAYTWTDVTRDEPFTDEPDSRRVTVQFWYPDIAQGEFPLVVFSHGAFGYRKSNLSTFIDLASNGYVVCSIDHPYHAFVTRQADGRSIPVDIGFLQSAIAAQNGTVTGRQLHDLEQSWMHLRTSDMQFVLDTIMTYTASPGSPAVFSHILEDAVGVFGHSMGGATAAAIGRDRTDVDAVIVLDGTMMGEQSHMRKEGDSSDAAYPKPILNLFNEEHGREAGALGDAYPNAYMHARSTNSSQVTVYGSGHLNFTDLPLVSPILARLLGTGSVDAVECIRTTNHLVRAFFDRHLKGAQVEISRERFVHAGEAL